MSCRVTIWLTYKQLEHEAPKIISHKAVPYIAKLTGFKTDVMHHNHMSVMNGLSIKIASKVAPWSSTTGERVVEIESRNIHGIQSADGWWRLNEHSFTQSVVQEEKRFS